MEKLSYAYSKQTARLYYTTIPYLLEKRAREIPNKPANIIRNLTNEKNKTTTRDVITFADLAENSLKLACAFLDAGIKPKDRIAIVGSCCPEYLYLEYACQRISSLMIRIPATIATSDALIDILKSYNVRALVVEPGHTEEKINGMLPGLLSDDKSAAANRFGLTYLDHFIYLTNESPRLRKEWKSIMDLCEESTTQTQDLVKKIQKEQDPDDPSVVLPTSGSTGTSKFILHSHSSFIHWVTGVYCAFANPESSDFLYMSDRPPSWAFGFTMLPSFVGCTLINLDPAVSKTEGGMAIYADVVREEEVTATFALNYVLYDMMIATKSGLLTLPPSLQDVMTGGERTPDDVFEFARSSFKSIALVYGTSEVGGLSYAKSHERPADAKYEDFSWMSLDPSSQFKVTDEDGKLLPCGAVGDISVKTCATMIGYLEDDLQTRTALSPNGWFKTGDLGMIREDGKIRVVGRTKDVISKGGTQIYPAQAELIVSKHPAVLKVVVIGVPDTKLFNEVCACVIPKPGESVTEGELRKFCEEQSLTDTALALPKYYMIVQEYPTVSTGKVDKISLRTMAVSAFNLPEKCYSTN